MIEEFRMGRNVRSLLCVVALLFLVVGCGDKEAPMYQGVQYPATSTVIPSFQADQVPVSCSVFAHLLAWQPAGVNGQTIARTIEQEARRRGADMVLLGGTREAEEDKGLEFVYYGPANEYKCRDKWCGWKFGYADWARQGKWVSFGFKEWGNSDATYATPLVIQAAFLKCQK